MKNNLTSQDIREAIEKNIIIDKSVSSKGFKEIGYNFEGLYIKTNSSEEYFSFNNSFCSFEEISRQYNEIDR